jgi:hypothetical protein
MAIIRDSSGMNYSTAIVDSLFFMRDKRHVKMYKPFDVPTNFGSRTGRIKSCKIAVNDDLTNATSAKLVVSSWSGTTPDLVRHELQLNDIPFARDIGNYHNYSFDYVDISLSCLNKLSDTNTVTVYSEYDGHTFEINWPGPALLVEFINDSVPLTPEKPVAPQNLQVELFHERLAKLSWEHVDDNLGYVIERKRTSFDYQVLTTMQPDINWYKDKTLFYTTDVDTVAYSYRIYAYNCAGNSDYSNEAFLYNSDLTTGVPEMKQQGITIYPNPVNDFITIQFGNYVVGTGQVEMYDLNGKMVNAIEFNNKDTKRQIKLSVNSLEKGFYILKININGKIENKKIIVK